MSFTDNINGYNKSYINGNSRYVGNGYDCPGDTTEQVLTNKSNSKDNHHTINFSNNENKIENSGIDA